MSKRPRPADPRQPDLFGVAASDPAAGGDLPLPDAPSGTASAEAATAEPGKAGATSPMPYGTVPDGAVPDEAEPSEPVPDVAASALPSPDVMPPHQATRAGERPAFRRVDPLGLRAADPPDSYLYCVVTREIADRVLRDGLPDEDPPALVERGAVPCRLAATAADLGWSDEQPGAIAVLRVRRGEMAQADAAPRHGPRLRRTG